MNFDFTEDQRVVQETFARFSDEQIAPKAEALDEAHAFPREVFEQLGELGFFGMRYPEEVGGTGLDLLSLCLAVTEIARGSASVAGVATMQSLMGTHFLHALGNDDIKERLFAPALLGEKVGGICMTEPDFGQRSGRHLHLRRAHQHGLQAQWPEDVGDLRACGRFFHRLCQGGTGAAA